MTARRHFASDNQAGVHPDVMEAMLRVNAGHVSSYGHDALTERVEDLFRRQFGPGTRAFLVFNGTAANVLGIQSVTQRHHAVICGEAAHLNVDECGAPERFTGCKLLTVPTPDGKLRPQDVAASISGVGDEHRVQPRVVSITQSTEVGTVYSIAEIQAIAEVAHTRDLLLHMDGSRIANAAVSLDRELREITTDAGVDILSFGGTKNGVMGVEAVVFLNGLEPRDFLFIRKQGMQLGSKMRFMAAQLEALLGTDLWRRNASNANRMAQRLAEQVRSVPGIRITQSVDANGVFAIVPAQHVPALQEVAMFYVWNPVTSEVRWMTAWDTTEDDVDRFAQAVREIVR
jgi:threonine aldolase